MGFDSDCGVMNVIHSQSPDISMGVDTGGAGDQGIMFGGAVKETEELMPLALVLSREILVRLTKMMKAGEITWARPDQKSQVTLAYDENGNVDHVDSIVVSVQHDEEVSHAEIEKTIIENIKKTREGKTNIIVAHRISAVRHADKIVVLDNGKILNFGTHDELLEKCPWYKQLDEYQNKEVEDDEE